MGFREYVAEFAATFLLLLIGLSAVVVNFAADSPIPSWIESENVRRLLTGLLFAGGATAVVHSPLGQRSGGHLNPAVTLAFFRLEKMTRRNAASYIAAQFLGALAGRPRLMRYTAAAAGALVAFLVFVEAPVSGSSLNPARSVAPAIAAGSMRGCGST